VAAIQKYEDLVAWQKSRVLTRDIYVVTRQQPFDRDFGLRDQVRRTAVSIMANIAEGFERRSQADFAHFLLVAKASCAEVGSHLYVALDVGYLAQMQFDELKAQVDEIGRIIGGLHSSVMRTLADGQVIQKNSRSRISNTGARNSEPTRISDLGSRI